MTRIGMIALGLVAWLTSIALLSTPGIIAAALLVAWATFGLITERSR